MGYEENGNQSFRRVCLSHFVSPSVFCLLFLYSYPLVLLGANFKRTGGEGEGWGRKKGEEEWRLPTVFRGFCFSALQGENTIPLLLFCPQAASLVIFLPSLMMQFEGMFFSFCTTLWFLSLHHRVDVWIWTIYIFFWREMCSKVTSRSCFSNFVFILPLTWF